MLDTLIGFAVVGLAIVVGYVIGRIDLLGEQAGPVLSRLVFFVLSPFLMFVVLSEADARMLFSGLLVVSALATGVMLLIFALISRFLWRRPFTETWIGAMAAGQVNSNNIGIPLSLYLLGSAAYPAPVILMQLLVLTPATLLIMDISTNRQASLLRTVVRALSNPIIIGAAAGTLMSVLQVDVPAIIMEPARLIANACVPILLISYGISLYGQRVLAPSARRPDILLASALKLFGMPLVAWVLAQFVFGLSAHEVLVVVVLAALPSAQNVFNTAQRYRVGEVISRDTIFITTIGCVPILFLVMVLLG